MKISNAIEPFMASPSGYRKKMSKIIVELICVLFVFLFVYTAVSKFIDYQDFKAVIGQSPLVTNFAGSLSIAVPLLEIAISLFLIVPRWRLIGLYASFALMVIFTTYIVILVSFSEDIPCSCGGVISRMSWQEHIVFNIFFVLLAFVGMILQTKTTSKSSK